MRGIAQEVRKAVGQQAAAARDILKASQSATRLSSQVHRASTEQAKGAAQIVKTTESMRRSAAATTRAMNDHAVAVDQITKAAESLSRLIATVTRSMHEQTSATNEVAAAVSSMRKEGEQASRALAEQARAMRDVLSNSQNITKQIDLITKANKQHSSRAGRVLTQLKDVRAITERNARSARDTQGGTGDLLRHAEALTGALTPQKNGSNGRVMNRIGILTTDTDLVVTTWDATLEQMTGIPADRARGRRLEEIVPDLRSRMLIDLIREPLISGSAQVLAPALHKYLIPCPPLEPSHEFEHMQQRVVVGALRDAHRSVGLVMSIEDVTERLERERELARQLRDQSPSARLEAVEQLAHEPADGIGPLGVAMGDEDWRVRRAAVKALAARRDEALVDGVIAALRDGHRDFSVLSSALQLLTLTGVDSTKALVRLMDDADADLRIQAALALGSQRHAGGNRSAASRARRHGSKRAIPRDRIPGQARVSGRDRQARGDRGVARFLSRVSGDRGARPHQRSGHCAQDRPAPRRSDAERGRGGGAWPHRR